MAGRPPGAHAAGARHGGGTAATARPGARLAGAAARSGPGARVAVFAMLAAATLARPALAAPFVPASDSALVATLPGRLMHRAVPGWPARPSRPAPPQALAPAALPPIAPALAPALGPALRNARLAIEQARHAGDPRELGRAQAALLPWWGQPDPPPPVRLLRAVIRQSQHQFDAAVADLDALLLGETGRRTRWPLAPAVAAQARYTRASIHQVQGRHAAAAADCRGLLSMLPLHARACLAELRSLQHPAEAETARAELATLAGSTSTTLTTATNATEATATAAHAISGTSHTATAAARAAAGPPWLALMRAELAARLGHVAEAERLFHAASAGPAGPDAYTLAAHADLLLQARRPRAALALLQGREEVDALRLRQALAWQQLGQTAALREATADLQARFDAAARRGENPHLREQARFTLSLLGRPHEALALAEANWRVQREPADARLLAEARAAARAPS